MTQLKPLSRPVRLSLLTGFLVCQLAIVNPVTSAFAQNATATPSPTSTATPLPPPTDTPIPSSTPTATSQPTSTATATATSILTSTPTTSVTASATATPSDTAHASTTTTSTNTAAPPSTATPTNTPTSSATPTSKTGKPPSSYPPRSVLVNEIAWSGTVASAYDEWIELHNPGPVAIDLANWSLTDDGDIQVTLDGTIPAYGFYLLERTDDSTIANIDADQIYTGGLKNSGESLRLLDPTGKLIDSADYPSGWPAGDAAARASMERRGGKDLPGNWTTYGGLGGRGRDILGNAIHGTPRQTNSLFLSTSTPTTTPTMIAQPPPTNYPPQAVMINEIAWAGTRASSNDEWIELHNPGAETINLEGWKLSDDGDINITLHGTIQGYGYYLLERTDDTTLTDLAANQIYSGSLKNSGEILQLRDANGNLIDSANSDGGGWPAGNGGSRASMERRGGKDKRGNWGTYTGYHGVGRDSKGGHVPGTPGTTNSLFFPTPVPTWIPGKVIINEVLIRPHYDWEGVDGASTDDEFIELYNLGPRGVDLTGFMLDDVKDGGSKPFVLPEIRLPPGEFAVFFRSQTRISLNDSGDDVRLLAPNGHVVNDLTYLRVRAYNLSYGRLPDGSRHLYYGLWPTPGKPNLLFEEPTSEVLPPSMNILRHIPIMRLARLMHYPALVYRLYALGLVLLAQTTPDAPFEVSLPMTALVNAFENTSTPPNSHPRYLQLSEFLRTVEINSKTPKNIRRLPWG